MSISRPHTLVIEDTGIGIRAEDLPRVLKRGLLAIMDVKRTGLPNWALSLRKDYEKAGSWNQDRVGAWKRTKVFLELGRKKMDLY